MSDSMPSPRDTVCLTDRFMDRSLAYCCQTGGSQRPLSPLMAWKIAFYVAAILFASLCDATPALAHKMFIFATVRAKRIEGEVNFLGGEPADNVKVTLFGPEGTQLGQTRTDQEGNFTFAPQFRCDYKLVADGGFGHGVDVTLEQSELPAELPAFSRDAVKGEDGPTASVTADSAAHLASSAHGEHAALHDEDLSQQIAALRKDVDKWQAELRLQDILGGVGYILGLTGLVFYFLGARRKERRTEAGS